MSKRMRKIKLAAVTMQVAVRLFPFTTYLRASVLARRGQRDPKHSPGGMRWRTPLFVLLVALCAGDNAKALEGTASWNIDLVREYIKAVQGVDIGAEPGAFPRREKLSEINPEFALRLKTLMSVYQAHGGSPVIGIMPDGGLRTPQRQREIFEECRHIRWTFSQSDAQQDTAEPLANAVPAGDGSSKEHWEVDWVPVGDGKGNLTWQPVCGQPPTDAWVSWHNLGLAVDFAYTNNDAYGRMVSAANDLGLTWGGWFGGRASGFGVFDALSDKTLSPHMRHTAEALGWDLGHFEWHPGQYDAEKFMAQAGSALDTSYLHTGYRWKLPDEICWLAKRQGSPPELHVFHFVEKDSWIFLDRMRVITGDASEWFGNWYSFDKPIRLFPAYIPTVRFFRTTKDEFARGSTPVKHVFYRRGPNNEQYQSSQGYWNYHPGFTMKNWEIEAGNEIQQQDYLRRAEYKRTKAWPPRYPGYDGYREFLNASVYDVEVHVPARTVMNVSLDRGVNPDGHTVDRPPNQEKSGTEIKLSMGWDRDNGKVGMPLVSLSTQGIALAASAHGDTVSATCPGAAFDQATPPPPPPANPRPVPRSNFNWRP